MEKDDLVRRWDWRNVGAATPLLLMALAVVFAVECLQGAVGDDERLLSLGALPDQLPLDGQYWRLVSFGFLHSSLTHLLLNSLLLLLAGPIVERRSSAVWMSLLFLAASVASGIAIAFKHALWPQAGVSVGASGGMFGLLGAGLVLVLPGGGRDGFARAVLVTAVVCGLAYSLLPHISMTGHLAGLLVGAGVVALRRLPSYTRSS